MPISPTDGPTIDPDGRRPKPADGDDMTWNDSDCTLTYAALVKTVYQLQNEVAGLAAQVVEQGERLRRIEVEWDGD